MSTEKKPLSDKTIQKLYEEVLDDYEGLICDTGNMMSLILLLYGYAVGLEAELARPSPWIPTYDVNVKSIHHAIDKLMEHIEKADGNTAILICEIEDELHGSNIIQIQLRAEANPSLFLPAPAEVKHD